VAYPSIVTSGNFTNDSGGGPVCDFRQDGQLWVAAVDTTNDVIDFFYSSDGQTWTQALTSLTDFMTTGNQVCSFFIDKDDNAHIVYLATASGRDIHYRLGVANGNDWVWSSPISLKSPSATDIGQARTVAVVAHREGTGWKAHCIHTEDQVASTVGVTYWTTISIDGSHIPTFEQRTILKNWGVVAGQAQVYMDFRHTQDDSKAVQASTPNVYVGYHSPAGTGVFFKKLSYSAGTWTPGIERTINANTQDAFLGQNGMVYDGTRVLFVSLNDASDTVVRVDERDEADTTTTNRDPTALADGIVRAASIAYAAKGVNADIWVVARGATSFDTKKIRFDRGAGTWGSWTIVEADTSVAVFGNHWLMRSKSSSGILGLIYPLLSASPDQTKFAKIVAEWEAQSTLQGVATLTAPLSISFTIESLLQGVGSLSGGVKMSWGLESTLQGVASLVPKLSTTPRLDFTAFDGYLYAPDTDDLLELIYHDDTNTRPQTVSVDLRPARSDVGNEPTEVRPESGEVFSQQDFSHGAGQLYFHHEGRDVRRFLWSEGFDLEIDTVGQPAILRHLRNIGLSVSLPTMTSGRLEVFNDLVFVADGTGLWRGNLIGAWVFEQPSGAETVTTLSAMSSSGEFLYAALGANGIHRRDTAGAWAHWSDVPALIVAWVKNRIMAASATTIYEVVTTPAVPTAIETLPAGWTFTSIFEAGGFVYATAVNVTSGLSRVHTYGLNTTSTAIEKKNETPAPRDQLFKVGRGYLGTVYLGGGIKTDAGGFDPVLYQALPQDDGTLTYAKIAEGEGAGPVDLSVEAIEPIGEDVLFGWSLGSGFAYGPRDGLAVHKLRNGAFLSHVKKNGAGFGRRVQGIVVYHGKIVFTLVGDGVYVEDTAKFVVQAQLVSSVADWQTTARKAWDLMQVSHAALPADTTVTLEYTTRLPSDAQWVLAVRSDVDGAEVAEERFDDLDSRLLAVRLSSNANPLGTEAPRAPGFLVRSNLLPDNPEYALVRFVRLLSEDRKDDDAPMRYMDVEGERRIMHQLAHKWVTVYEPGVVWIARVARVAEAEPAVPVYQETKGEARRQGYIMQLTMAGTRD
jgi:hypothetical protein